MAKQLQLSVAERCGSLATDPAASVRRELAIALRHDRSKAAPGLWAKLATQLDPSDRWMVEALGIGSDLRAAEYFDAWMREVGGDWNTPAGREIVWRTRAPAAAAKLVELIGDPSLKLRETNRYFRALEYHPAPVRTEAMKTLLSVK